MTQQLTLNKGPLLRSFDAFDLILAWKNVKQKNTRKDGIYTDPFHGQDVGRDEAIFHI